MKSHVSAEINQKIKHLRKDKIYDYAVLEMDGVNKSSIRSAMQRLEEQGKIVKTGRAHFKKTEPFSELVFVYGTMKRGMENHDRLKDAKYLGKYESIRHLPMVADSSGYFPYVLNDKKGGFRIRGELYEIRHKTLMKAMDLFEGVPELYTRSKIYVKNKDAKTALAWIYFRSYKNPYEIKDYTPMKEWGSVTRKHRVSNVIAATQRQISQSLKA